jgi:hypothetical protein
LHIMFESQVTICWLSAVMSTDVIGAVCSLCLLYITTFRISSSTTNISDSPVLYTTNRRKKGRRARIVTI